MYNLLGNFPSASSLLYLSKLTFCNNDRYKSWNALGLLCCLNLQLLLDIRFGQVSLYDMQTALLLIDELEFGLQIWTS